MKRRKRRYTKRTGKRAIEIIQRIRSRNNRNWMALLELALAARPRETRKLLAQISENDEEVRKWLTRV